MANEYSFSAVRGQQAGGDFYIAMCDMKYVASTLTFDADLPPEQRAQRTLRKSRIPKIRDYILQNPKDYIFSSITVSVDDRIKFEPVAGNDDIGKIHISQNATMLINDGQHRVHAIRAAIEENPSLISEHISVVFFEDRKLKKCQQMFADLNKHALKPTKSLGILYDHRNDFATFVVGMVDQVKVFSNRIEVEKTSLSNRATKFFTLSGIAAATKQLLGKEKYLKENERELAILFWNTVGKNIPEWQLLVNNKVSAHELRKDYVHAHTNTLESIATAGNTLIKKYKNSWRQKLAGLQNIDWTKKNPEWDGNLINGRTMAKTRSGMNDAAKIILKYCEDA